MRHGHGSDLMTKRENCSLEHQSNMGLAEYIFISHQRICRGYLEGYPACQACDQSFEEPATKAPSRTRTSRPEPPTISSPCSNGMDLLLPAVAHFPNSINSIIARRKDNGRC